ncbi:hypothetical protein [Streptomyces echinatus]|uniref:SH3b domain-containing protein n=1 Tax=Streptomyces echinatus TaxID=67293 RepID=A0A7W9UWD6_9ACTN|nr:hypothetical protein [Streptomyces echinatus]MBB5932564.1 hypothetical protein [Streptomyces echinatus]
MIRRLILTTAAIVLASAACLPQASATVTAGPHFNSCGYQVTGDGVRLRTGPGNGTVRGLLHRGDTVYADKAHGDWWRVRLAYDSGSASGTRKTTGLRAGTAGWMAKRYARAHTCMQTD